MSQWGAVKTISGHRFIPWIGGQIFTPAADTDLIMAIYLTHIFTDRPAGNRKEILDALTRDFVGRPYGFWAQADMRKYEGGRPQLPASVLPAPGVR